VPLEDYAPKWSYGYSEMVDPLLKWKETSRGDEDQSKVAMEREMVLKVKFLLVISRYSQPISCDRMRC
jgi:hypothetical protein